MLRTESQDEYPTWIGLIFIFNLIVGTGALTLPAMLAKAGWFLSGTLIMVLALISYITVTYVIETMACANAVIHWRQLQFLKRDGNLQGEESDEDEDAPLHRRAPANDYSNTSFEQTPLFSQTSRFYVLTQKMELGEMAGLFFNDFGRILFYLCIAIYLYGDLSIYSAVVSKTMRDVLCSYNQTTNSTDDELDNELCWDNHTLTRLDCYRFSLIGFVCLLGPFTFFNIQKTKYIQLLSGLFRWFAFIIMISIAVHRIFINGPQGHPPAGNILGVPALFGACVYSFMCHHSLPSLIVPISNKKSLKMFLPFDFLLICGFYLFLALTGAFAFAQINDIYTLNFVPTSDQSPLFLKIVEYFLALFPVLTLSASYPIIAITLRNNLQSLFLDTTRLDSYHFVLRNMVFPMMAILPPAIVTYFTDSVTGLVGFTGTYAGTGIQYLIPVFLVYSARNTCTELLGQGIINEYRSPFRGSIWLLFVLLWAITCVVLITINFFVNIK